MALWRYNTQDVGVVKDMWFGKVGCGYYSRRIKVKGVSLPGRV